MMVRPGEPRSKPKRLRSTARPARGANRREPVSAEQVALVRTRGTKGRGGGSDGEAWRIELDGKRCGRVFINLIDASPLGVHASIQIYLNQSSQGRHIGRVAYAKAAQASRYDVIYAHMQKANIASARAAEEAGFVDATPPEERQKVMIWRRHAEAHAELTEDN